MVAVGIYKEDFDDLQTAAVTASVAAALQAMMPVGFVVTLGVSTNPATLYGFGTWTKIEGKVVVGISAADTEFDTLNETGGAKTHTLTYAQMPAHNHGINAGFGDTGTGDILRYQQWAGNGRGYQYTLSGGQTISTEGGGQAHNNL